MSQRVLATRNAAQAATRMRALLQGDVQRQMRQLATDGDALSQPTVWDGPRATTFRTSTWPPARTSLQAALAALDHLAAQAVKAIADIEAAGGTGALGTTSRGGVHLPLPGALGLLSGAGTAAQRWAAMGQRTVSSLPTLVGSSMRRVPGLLPWLAGPWGAAVLDMLPGGPLPGLAAVAFVDREPIERALFGTANVDLLPTTLGVDASGTLVVDSTSRQEQGSAGSASFEHGWSLGQPADGTFPGQPFTASSRGFYDRLAGGSTLSFPGQPDQTPGHDPRQGLGLYGGASTGVDLSNARQPQDLSGPFTTYAVGGGWLLLGASVQLSVGQNAAHRGIYNLAIGAPPAPGFGFGGYATRFDTTTDVTTNP
jgi:hypothetical protein